MNRERKDRTSAISKLCAGSRIAQPVTGGNEASKYLAATSTTVITMAITYSRNPTETLIVDASVP